MSGGGGGEGEGKLPSVDHGRRTDRGRDKKCNCIYISDFDLFRGIEYCIHIVW